MIAETFDLATTAPAEPFAEGKTRIARAVESHRAEILELSHRIHADPEPAFEEFHASAAVAEALRRHGYVVEHPVGSLATAVRGRLAGGRGGDRPRIGILAEYDALPGLGHGCGHNTMAASGVGAAIALAEMAPELPGEIVFLGTPAEERGSGKAHMIRDGLFEGLDAALLFHPSDTSYVTCRLLASEDVYVTFHGLQAHAASEPWMGRNALDALIVLFSAVGSVAPAAPARCPGPRDRPGGRDRGEHHPGPGEGLVHGPLAARGRVPRDARALPARCARPRLPRPAAPSRSSSTAAPRR